MPNIPSPQSLSSLSSGSLSYGYGSDSVSSIREGTKLNFSNKHTHKEVVRHHKELHVPTATIKPKPKLKLTNPERLYFVRMFHCYCQALQKRCNTEMTKQANAFESLRLKASQIETLKSIYKIYKRGGCTNLHAVNMKFETLGLTDEQMATIKTAYQENCKCNPCCKIPEKGPCDNLFDDENVFMGSCGTTRQMPGQPGGCSWSPKARGGGTGCRSPPQVSKFLPCSNPLGQCTRNIFATCDDCEKEKPETKIANNRVQQILEELRSLQLRQRKADPQSSIKIIESLQQLKTRLIQMKQSQKQWGRGTGGCTSYDKNVRQNRNRKADEEEFEPVNKVQRVVELLKQLQPYIENRTENASRKSMERSPQGNIDAQHSYADYSRRKSRRHNFKRDSDGTKVIRPSTAAMFDVDSEMSYLNPDKYDTYVVSSNTPVNPHPSEYSNRSTTSETGAEERMLSRHVISRPKDLKGNVSPQRRVKKWSPHKDVPHNHEFRKGSEELTTFKSTKTEREIESSEPKTNKLVRKGRAEFEQKKTTTKHDKTKQTDRNQIKIKSLNKHGKGQEITTSETDVPSAVDNFQESAHFLYSKGQLPPPDQQPTSVARVIQRKTVERNYKTQIGPPELLPGYGNATSQNHPNPYENAPMQMETQPTTFPKDLKSTPQAPGYNMTHDVYNVNTTVRPVGPFNQGSYMNQPVASNSGAHSDLDANRTTNLGGTSISPTNYSGPVVPQLDRYQPPVSQNPNDFDYSSYQERYPIHQGHHHPSSVYSSRHGPHGHESNSGQKNPSYISGSDRSKYNQHLINTPKFGTLPPEERESPTQIEVHHNLSRQTKVTGGKEIATNIQEEIRSKNMPIPEIVRTKNEISLGNPKETFVKATNPGFAANVAKAHAVPQGKAIPGKGGPIKYDEKQEVERTSQHDLHFASEYEGPHIRRTDVPKYHNRPARYIFAGAKQPTTEPEKSQHSNQDMFESESAMQGIHHPDPGYRNHHPSNVQAGIRHDPEHPYSMDHKTQIEFQDMKTVVTEEVIHEETRFTEATEIEPPSPPPEVCCDTVICQQSTPATSRLPNEPFELQFNNGPTAPMLIMSANRVQVDKFGRTTESDTAASQCQNQFTFDPSSGRRKSSLQNASPINYCPGGHAIEIKAHRIGFPKKQAKYVCCPLTPKDFFPATTASGENILCLDYKTLKKATRQLRGAHTKNNFKSKISCRRKKLPQLTVNTDACCKFCLPPQSTHLTQGQISAMCNGCMQGQMMSWRGPPGISTSSCQ